MLLRWMQITIGNYITKKLFFIRRPESNCIIIRWVECVGGWEEGNYNFCNSKFVVPSRFCVMPDCGNIKFHCNMWGRTGHSFCSIALHRFDDIIAVFSGDYHFCILLSNSLSEFIPQLNPPISIRIQFSLFSGHISAVQLWIVDSLTFVTIRWLSCSTV